MIYLLAGLALIVALAALFLAADATRKADHRILDFVARHITPIQESIKKNIAPVKDLRSSIKTLEGEVETIRKAQDEALKRMTRLDDEIRDTRAELKKLDHTIPPLSKNDAAVPGAI